MREAKHTCVWGHFELCELGNVADVLLARFDVDLILAVQQAIELAHQQADHFIANVLRTARF